VERLLNDLLGLELRQANALGYLLDDFFLGHARCLLEQKPLAGPIDPPWNASNVKVPMGNVKAKGRKAPKKGACPGSTGDSVLFWFPNSVGERGVRESLFRAPADAKRSFAKRRSQTEFGNEEKKVR